MSAGRVVRLPNPFEWLTLWASAVASLSAAIAPAYGLAPAAMGGWGLVAGLIVGAPAYLRFTWGQP